MKKLAEYKIDGETLTILFNPEQPTKPFSYKGDDKIGKSVIRGMTGYLLANRGIFNWDSGAKHEIFRYIEAELWELSKRFEVVYMHSGDIDPIEYVVKNPPPADLLI